MKRGVKRFGGPREWLEREYGVWFVLGSAAARLWRGCNRPVGMLGIRPH